MVTEQKKNYSNLIFFDEIVQFPLNFTPGRTHQLNKIRALSARKEEGNKVKKKRKSVLCKQLMISNSSDINSLQYIAAT